MLLFQNFCEKMTCVSEIQEKTCNTEDKTAKGTTEEYEQKKNQDNIV